MAAPTTDQPTATGSVSAGSRPSTSQNRRRNPTWAWYLLIAVLSMIIIGMIFMAAKDSREIYRLKDEKLELRRAAYERELNGLAMVKETNTVYTVSLSDRSSTGFWAVSTTTNESSGDTVCERPMLLPDGAHSFPWFEEVPLDGSPDGAYCVTKVAKPGG